MHGIRALRIRTLGQSACIRSGTAQVPKHEAPLHLLMLRQDSLDTQLTPKAEFHPVGSSANATACSTNPSCLQSWVQGHTEIFPGTNARSQAARAARRTSHAVGILLLEHAAVRVVGRAHVRAHHMAQLVPACPPSRQCTARLPLHVRPILLHKPCVQRPSCWQEGHSRVYKGT